MKVGDIVKHNDRAKYDGIGLVLKILPHPFLPQNGQLCKVQWHNDIVLVMQSFLEVINESR